VAPAAASQRHLRALKRLKRALESLPGLKALLD
jgi:hypothetical protein